MFLPQNLIILHIRQELNKKALRIRLISVFLVQDNIIESKPFSYQQESRQFEQFAKFSSIRQNSSSFKERSQ
ncbi:unnamed protein product [Paramecium octaurelia]|uniref:Uncharacterized protein n=1 Tax=Paramecium octaurelia TaxID=43137 RepID=A0A8S1UEN1_PAROT|nr:unnamed protein product [Paramecium octaurelia]